MTQDVITLETLNALRVRFDNRQAEERRKIEQRIALVTSPDDEASVRELLVGMDLAGVQVCVWGIVDSGVMYVIEKDWKAVYPEWAPGFWSHE